MNKPTLFIDVDGVLLDWFNPFHAWMKRQGMRRVRTDSYDMRDSYPSLATAELRRLVLDFNQSPAFRDLQPDDDARKALWNIHHELPDWPIRYVSSCGSTAKIQEARSAQLTGIPSPMMLTCLRLGASKRPIFQQVARAIVVEDSPEQLRVAEELGHFTVCVRQPWNRIVDGTIRINHLRDLTPEALRKIEKGRE